MYTIIKKLLFNMDPEQAHTLALHSLKLANQLHLLRIFTPHFTSSPKKVMGLTFPNLLGLAAGLDKNADYVEALSALGFGFIEIGTVTPKPQMGNPRPRLFRLTKENAIINRMGFNSKGVEYVAEQLNKTTYRGILGVNLGKNKETPIDHAIDDYVFGFKQLSRFASYVTINISSPNTAGLRDLQQSDLLKTLLQTMKQEQKILQETQQKYVPLVVKIAPDLSFEELEAIAEILLTQKIDGVIATNTTLSRDGVSASAYANESGGLSGQPLQAKNTEIIRQLHGLLQNHIPIIAAGGIMDAASAQEKIRAGADLLQIYTGFIYQGPALIKDILTQPSPT